MRILFVYYKCMASFIEKDLDILKERHEVRVVRFLNVLDAYSLWKGARWSQVIYSWFGSLHSLFAVLFSRFLGKKSIVVAGGYDVACVPEIGYGLFCSRWKRWLPLIVFRLADRILTVSRSNTVETLLNAKADSDKVRLLYHGFETELSQDYHDLPKQPLALTVGNVSRSTLTKKGLELFARASSLLPGVKFVAVGRWIDDAIERLKILAAPNVTFLDEMDQQRLFALMSKSKVYVQVSLHESFGCALAEAMLCKCIPVASSSMALPEVVGDCGFLLAGRSPEALADLIEQALRSDAHLGERARERIQKLFPLEKRKKALLEIVEQMEP